MAHSYPDLQGPQLTLAIETLADGVARDANVSLESVGEAFAPTIGEAWAQLGRDEVVQAQRMALDGLRAKNPEQVDTVVEDVRSQPLSNMDVVGGATIVIGLGLVLGLVKSIRIGPGGFIVETREDLPPRLHSFLKQIVERIFDSTDASAAELVRKFVEVHEQPRSHRRYWWMTGRKLLLLIGAIRTGLMAPEQPLQVRRPTTESEAIAMLSGLLLAENEIPTGRNESRMKLVEAMKAALGQENADALTTQRRDDSDEGENTDHDAHAIADAAEGFDRDDDVPSFSENADYPNFVTLSQTVKDWKLPIDVEPSLKELRDKMEEIQNNLPATFSIGYEVLGGELKDGRLSLTIGTHPLLDKDWVGRRGSKLKKLLGAELFIHRSSPARATVSPYPHHIGKGASIQDDPGGVFSLGPPVREAKEGADHTGGDREYCLIPAHALANFANEGLDARVLCPPGSEQDARPLGRVIRTAWSNGSNPVTTTDAALVEIAENERVEGVLGSRRYVMNRPSRDLRTTINEGLNIGREVRLYSDKSPDGRRVSVREIETYFSSVLIPEEHKPASQWQRYRLSNVSLAGDPQVAAAQAGDSGGVATDGDSRPLGTIVGSVTLKHKHEGNVNMAIIVPLWATLDALGVTL